MWHAKERSNCAVRSAQRELVQRRPRSFLCCQSFRTMYKGMLTILLVRVSEVYLTCFHMIFCRCADSATRWCGKIPAVLCTWRTGRIVCKEMRDEYGCNGGIALPCAVGALHRSVKTCCFVDLRRCAPNAATSNVLVSTRQPAHHGLSKTMGVHSRIETPVDLGTQDWNCGFLLRCSVPRITDRHGYRDPEVSDPKRLQFLEDRIGPVHVLAP